MVHLYLRFILIPGDQKRTLDETESDTDMVTELLRPKDFGTNHHSVHEVYTNKENVYKNSKEWREKKFIYTFRPIATGVSWITYKIHLFITYISRITSHSTKYIP